MKEAQKKTSNIGLVLEELKGHDWITCKTHLTEDEEERHAGTEDNEAYDLGRGPRERFATKVKTKKDHNYEASNGKTSKPIDRFHAIENICSWIMHIQEQEKEDKRRARYWKIDPEDPSPRGIFG
jgi:hypothetical protein